VAAAAAALGVEVQMAAAHPLSLQLNMATSIGIFYYYHLAVQRLAPIGSHHGAFWRGLQVKAEWGRVDSRTDMLVRLQIVHDTVLVGTGLLV
jgi:hypothetical protein